MDAPTEGLPSGFVVESASGLPLSGVEVRWLAGDRSSSSGTELASAVSDKAGRFVLRVRDDEKAHRTYAQLRCDRQTEAWLVSDGGGAVRATWGAAGVALRVAAGRARPKRVEWQSLATFLATNRLLLTRDLVAQVAAPSPDSPAAGWSVKMRAGGLKAVQDALDRLDGATDALDANHPLDFQALERGRLSDAVSHFHDVRDVGLDPLGGLGLPKRDLELYRDYLRSIWVTAATDMYIQWGMSSSDVPAATLEGQLDQRFHQDFHTSDDTEQAATALLARLLSSALTAPLSGGGGFSLTPGAIPPQGMQTDDEYLDALVRLSKVSKQELRNRYRVSFEREPGKKVSPLALNVEALLGLLTDTYQSPEEPFPAAPPVSGKRPLIFGPSTGRAPFFLEYEEWLERQGTFYPENVYDIRRTIPFFDEAYRHSLTLEKGFNHASSYPNGYFEDYPNERAKSAEWVTGMFAIVDALNDALVAANQQNPEALRKLNDVEGALWKAAEAYDRKWVHDRFQWQWSNGNWWIQEVRLTERAKLRVHDRADLASFEAFFDCPGYPPYTGDQGDKLTENREEAVAHARTLYIYDVLYLHYVFLPYARAQIAFATGDYSRALRELWPLTGYEVGVAETNDETPYRLRAGPDRTAFYHEQTLPYTTSISFDQDHKYTDAQPFVTSEDFVLRLALAPFEERFFELFQGEAMLALADQLYRADDPSSIRRARELYKGVLFMHDEDPEIAPSWPGSAGKPSHGINVVWRRQDNPAKVSQVARGRLALYQIELGLNAYGYKEDMAPVLRYKPLKKAADLFAASAKSAQSDFLEYMTRLEQGQIELWQTRALVTKAQASAGIAGEHVEIAKAGVAKANEQVAAVQAQIAAKKGEIADHDSLFGEFKDYLAGVKDSAEGMLPLAKKVISGGELAAGTVDAESIAGIVAKGFSGGTASAEQAAASTLGSGAAFMIGYGAFVYVSYQTMQGMADAANKRDADLKTLETGALRAANAQVRLRERDVQIGQYEETIATADLEYSTRLLHFQQDRFLSVEFWNRLSLLANRFMRRYVDLAARTAWLAERALQFEQNRQIRLVALDYWPAKMRGVSGADRLLADLADLEGTRLQGVRLTAPVKHTISLAREFPLEFGQLKKTGRCRFRTDETVLRHSYPGTFGYRLRAVTIAAYDPDGPPPRGILGNGGISEVSRQDGQRAPLVRFPDALPLSEFRLHDDLFVYGLPGETLLQFEGSGFETDWELELPLDANPRGLRSLADVIVTFDMNASYAPAAIATPTSPGTVTRSLALAASVWDPRGLETLRAATDPARMKFDLRRVALPAQETGRKLANLALLFVGRTSMTYSATLRVGGQQARFQVEDGLALSNAGPLLGSATPRPLNALVGGNLDQEFVLEVSRSGSAVADELKRLLDVVIWLEYQATL